LAGQCITPFFAHGLVSLHIARPDSIDKENGGEGYNFASSALASTRMGMSVSASFEQHKQTIKFGLPAWKLICPAKRPARPLASGHAILSACAFG
jgi:hypothetical protein